MRILLFGGTTEGRLLTGELLRRGYDVTVSVATELGAEELRTLSCPVMVGRMDAEAMGEFVRLFDLVVDATHPYAAEASRNIRSACENAGAALRRVLRPASENGDSVMVENCGEAAGWLMERPGNVLLTIGSKELAAFGSLDPERLFPRVLPTHAALEVCEALSIPHGHILALRGPFSVELNAAMLRQYGIRYLVTKDGGQAGGLPEKLEAAKQTGVTVILVERPQDRGISPEALLMELEEQA